MENWNRYTSLVAYVLKEKKKGGGAPLF